MDSARDTAVNIARSLRDLVGDVWRSVIEQAGTILGRIDDTVRSAVSRALGAIRGLVGDFYSAGRALMEAFGRGIVSLASSIYGKVKGVVNKIKGLLPGSEPKDPSSPLRNLQASGAAILENMAAGLPRGARTLATELNAQLRTLPITAGPSMAPAGGPVQQNYEINRHYHIPPGPGAQGGYDPLYAASQLDQLMRNEGIL
jgi:phage-related protein